MNRQYIGARYVPLFADPIEWNDQKVYEPLTIVTYMGSSYTSRKRVPAGVRPTDNVYWALTGNYNAQVEQYRQEVAKHTQEVEELTGKVVTGILPEAYGAIGDGVTDDTNAIKQAVAECKANGGVLWLTRHYKITAPIGDIGNISVTGYGSKITSTYEGADPLFVVGYGKIRGVCVISNETHSGAIFECHDWNSLSFEDITLFYSKYGINFDNTASSFACYISGFNISGASEAGIRAFNCADIFIDKGVVHGCKNGIQVDKINGLYVSNIDIIACDVAFQVHYYGANNGSMFFSNVLFDTSNVSNFRTDGLVGTYGSGTMHFTNCWFSNCQATESVYLGSATNVQFTGCTFHYARGMALIVTDCKCVKIVGCTFFANSNSNHAHISVHSSDGTVINGCTIGGVGSGVFAGYKGFRPIEMTDCTNSVITGNYAYDNLDNDISGVGSTDLVKNNIGITDR